MTRRQQCIGHIGIDSGKCIVGDPCYFVGGNTVVGRKLKSNEFDAFYDRYLKTLPPVWPVESCGDCALAYVVQTGWGDGEYPVIATYNDEGRVAAVTVVFIPEDEDDDNG